MKCKKCQRPCPEPVFAVSSVGYYRNMLVQHGILPLPLSNSKITKTKKIYNFISFLCNSYIRRVKLQYRPCFGFSWRVQQSSIVIPTYTILCSNTIHKYPPSLCFLIISPRPSCALSLLRTVKSFSACIQRQTVTPVAVSICQMQLSPPSSSMGALALKRL